MFSRHLNGRLKKKPTMLDQLTDRFEKIGVAKYERKRAFNVKV